MRILTGIKPTGDGMHLGNYFGMFRPLQEISKDKESFLMVADLHSLTSVHNGDTLRHNKARMLREFIALFGEDRSIIIFEQSQVELHNDITWILSSVTPYSLMLRAHSFKDAEAKNHEVNMATFNYPILMTSDIITYDVDMVPVGKDQKQHVEFVRDIAENFNKTYKTDFFQLPEPVIQKDVGVIPGTDGRKMSKSYDNFLGIFDDEKTLKKKMMSIVTDDTPLEEPKDPDTCNVFALIQLLAPLERQQSIREKYKKGGYGYGHAKLELLDIFLEYFHDARERYTAMGEDMSEVQEHLHIGNTRARSLAQTKYQALKNIVGL